MTGKITAWLILAMMFLCSAIVLLRYGFSYSSTAMQEALVYLHGMAFMLASAYALSCDEHVRVDIFYRHFSLKQKAWVDACGCLFFLLPFCLFLLYFAWQFFYASYLYKEGSAEPGGLALVYLLKGIIPLSFALLLLQALAEFFKAASILIYKDK